MWGFSLGGNIARYLGAWSDQVRCIVVVGIAFGAAVSEQGRKDMRDHEAFWSSVLAEVQSSGKIPPDLSEDDRHMLETGWIATSLPLFRAMQRWPDIEPGEVRCPAMIVAGTANQTAVRRLGEQSAALTSAGISVHWLEGLNHAAELTRMEQVMPVVVPFLETHLLSDLD